MTSTATNNSLPEVGVVKSDILSQSAGGVIGPNTGRNVSVTPINMTDTQFNSGQFSYSSNGIRINVPSEEQRRVAGSVNIDDEDSNDAEVSKIDFSQTNHYQVNMRTKKKRPSSSTLSLSADGQTVQDNNAVSNDRDRERPMSWEGELSDSEMLVDSNTANTPDALLSNSKTPYSDLEFRLGSQKEGNGFCVKTEPIEREGAFVPANRHSSVSFQSLNDHDALNLKFGSSHHPTLQQHQRSHSMNRVSILSNDNNLDIKNSTLIPPKSHADLTGGNESGNEQIIKNIPVNIIPTTLSNKMASEAQAYAAKREQLMHQTTIPEIKPELPLLVDKLLGGYSIHSTPSNSPLLNRHHKIVSNPSTDSAIHSVYTHSVYSSPSASPGATRHAQYTPSLSRNNSDASHSSCYSYSSEFSPTHSPVQGRHPIPAHAAMLFRSEHGAFARQTSGVSSTGTLEGCTEGGTGSPDPEGSEDRIHHHQGVSRQQLINSPCPICGDKISGFHYGIFSCESCKGFFKRTVQNRKNYVCLRGANCPVTVATRKKCPACRFDKCLHCGMKLEAIREDRTRGGRSTYQCSYTLSGAASTSSLLGAGLQSGPLRHATSLNSVNGPSSHMSYHSHHDLHSASLSNSVQGPLNRLTQSGVKSEPGGHNSQVENVGVPALLQEIMDVEHLWQYNESELTRLNRGQPPAGGSSATTASPTANPFLRAAGVPADTPPDFLANLCNIADHRLYKIVKWCKSLPLFKNISIDDQICLLINSWCELLVLSCCYRGVSTPGEVRVGGGNGGITLQQSTKMGLSPCIERMLHFTDHLRRLRVDRYEYVAMKVIVLLNSDTSELKEPEKVRSSQGKALQALQDYTLAHYRDAPAKFGELLLRIPELQKTCQVGKEMLNPSNKNKDGETSSFNLLMELLRGDH